MRIPTRKLDLQIQPIIADQELDLAVRYWEGAVRVRGTEAGEPVAGHGYVELTGYAPRTSAQTPAQSRGPASARTANDSAGS